MRASAAAVALTMVAVVLPTSVAAAQEGPEHERRDDVEAVLEELAEAAEAVEADVEPDGCGPIVEDTVLDEERLACWDGVIVGDDLVVDLSGLVVRRSAVVEGERITLRNGTFDLAGAEPSFAAIFAGSALDLTVEDLVVRNLAGGWALEAGQRTTVRTSRFHDNAATAVSQYYGSGLVVEDSSFERNGAGVAIQDGSDARIERNRFVANTLGVSVHDEEFAGATDTTVVNNVFDGNTFGVRIRAQAAATGTVIDRNTIHRSRASGIAISSDSNLGDGPGGAAGTVVTNNVVGHSGSASQVVTGCDWGEFPPSCTNVTARDGITVVAGSAQAAATMTIAGNRALQNAGHGINAPGVTDGGRNLAPSNGATPACIGVSCRPGRPGQG